MKYTTEVIVDVPIETFVKKLNNPENMKHWQKGLLSYNLLTGTAGSEGAKMELAYKMGNRNMVLTETIVKRNLPHELHMSYDAKNVHNIQKNYFKSVEEHLTKWISESEFQFQGFMMKTMGFLMLVRSKNNR